MVDRALVRGQLSEHGIERTPEFIDRAGDSLGDIGRIVCDRHGLTAGNPRLHHAALILGSVLVAVFIAEMYFNSRESVGEACDAMPHRGFHGLGQRLMAIDVVIGIDKNIHAISTVVMVCDRKDAMRPW